MKVFLAKAKIQMPDGKLKTEFIESSDYATKDEFEVSLNQEGYIVIEIIEGEKFKMWE